MDTKVSATSNRAFNRAERTLNRWVGDKAITQAGKDWLVAAIDPFHDTALSSLQGWPDVESGMSVVRKIAQAVTLQKPSALPAGNWDLVIVAWPIIDDAHFCAGSIRLGNDILDTEDVNNIGGLQAFDMPAGHPFLPLDDPLVIEVGNLLIADPYAVGVGRLVAMGFESHNTTAEIYRQGAVGVGKMMQSQKDSDSVNIHHFDGVRSGVFSSSFVRLPPTTYADFMTLQGSRNWEASKGAYSVVQFHSNENPPFGNDYNLPILTRVEETASGPNNSVVWVPAMIPGITPTSLTTLPFHLHPTHTSMHWYSGLSEQSSILLSSIHYYESFPNQTQKDILVLATPSAEYDPMALEIYSHALSLMPPGVPVGENNAGDWFVDILDKAADFASWIPHPAVQTAAKLVKTGTGAYNAYNKGKVTSGTKVKSGKKKKKVQKKNASLAGGSRGRKGNIQGPMRQ